MTREEAYKWNTNSHDVNFSTVEEMEESIHYLLKRIYDSLENRNCSNCKFVGLTGYGNLKCENISSVICNKMTDYKISCTEWELNNEKI